MTHRVLVVEDDAAMRHRLVAVVDRHADLVLTRAVGTLADARRALAEDGFPDVLLVDLGLPDGDGTALLREVSTSGAPTRSLVVTIFGDEAHVIAALAAGAAGYLLKDARPDEVGRAILDTLSGGVPLSPMVARYLLREFEQARGTRDPHPGAPTLTPREREVLDLIAKGFSYDEVGALLSMSINTVRSHVRHLYRKLEVSSRGEAVFEARELGLLNAERGRR